MSEERTPVLLPARDRQNYKALNRELFWDVYDQCLYIRINDQWKLIGGYWKSTNVFAGDNLEIVFPVEGDTDHLHPVLKLKDDIVINTMELGKLSTTGTWIGDSLKGFRWKGLVKIGEIENSTFFPLIRFSESSKEILGGQFFVVTSRNDVQELGIYHATVCGAGNASIFGSDSQNVKCTINSVQYTDGEKALGFKTFSSLEKIITYETVKQADYQLTREVYFQLNTRDDIRFVSTEGGVARFTRRQDIYSTGNDALSAELCFWYELSLAEFRDITGIPEKAGLSLDQFDNGSYVYFDIYMNAEENAFSIDRAFITTSRATTEDEVVSEGRIWCHNPYWMTPNDKHTVDVGDDFKFISTVFDDSSDNISFTPGTSIKIMDVYANVAGGEITVKHEKILYSPPNKIEVWFNGWDLRESINKNIFLDRKDEDIQESLVVARN